MVKQGKVHLPAAGVGAATARAMTVARTDRMLSFIVVDCLKVVGKSGWRRSEEGEQLWVIKARVLNKC